MRILTISGGLRAKRIGGVPAYVEELLEELQARGHELTYLDFTGFKLGARTEIVREPDSQHYPQYTVVNSGVLVPWSWETSPLDQVRSSRRLRWSLENFLRDARPDIIHLHELLGVPIDLLTWLKRRGHKIILTSQDYYPVCPTVKLLRHDGINCTLPTSQLVCKECCAHKPNRWELRARTFNDRLARATGGRWPGLRSRLGKLGALPGMLYRRWVLTEGRYRARRREFVRHLRRADAVVCMSRLHEQVLRGILGPEAALRQMYLSRKSFKFQRVPPAPGRRQPAGKLVFIALNIVEPAKGSDLLRQAFGELEAGGLDFELRIYGASGQDSACIRHVARYHESELDRIVAEADFGIVPSVWREAYGYVGVEMLSRGLPILVSAWGAMTEYVRHGANGLVFDPASPAGLRQAAAGLLASPSLRETLWAGAASTPPFEGFAAHVDDVERVYAELCPAAGSLQRC